MTEHDAHSQPDPASPRPTEPSSPGPATPHPATPHPADPAELADPATPHSELADPAAQEALADYLGRLDQAFDDAAIDIDPGTREAVVDEVREHVYSHLVELDHQPSAADVRGILAELGSPTEIVASAEEPVPEPSHSVFGRAWVPWTYAALATVAFVGLLLTPFGFIPISSYVPLAVLALAVVLCIISPLWPAMEKIAAVLLAFLGPPAAIMLAVAHENSVLVCATGRSSIGIPGVLPCISGMVLAEVLIGLLLTIVFAGCVVFITVRGLHRARQR